mmetsp:Transcript_19342/g.42197  ORF Transcript_19342/g.42197 Transcript_19342/m.42197 type:complete len:172 (+) Transcript_19342:263-778(+)
MASCRIFLMAAAASADGVVAGASVSREVVPVVPYGAEDVARVVAHGHGLVVSVILVEALAVVALALKALGRDDSAGGAGEGAGAAVPKEWAFLLSAPAQVCRSERPVAQLLSLGRPSQSPSATAAIRGKPLAAAATEQAPTRRAARFKVLRIGDILMEGPDNGTGTVRFEI